MISILKKALRFSPISIASITENNWNSNISINNFTRIDFKLSKAKNKGYYRAEIDVR